MIAPTAIIDPSAKIAADVEIGPYSIIGPHVEIEAGTRIGPHVVIRGPTRIGKNNKIYQFSSIGEDSQDKKYVGGKTYLEIGDNNQIREFVTISRGTAEGGITRIGNGNLLMAYVHVAHDCVVGNEIVFSNNASLAGHVMVQDRAILGGFVGVHQFCRIGEYAFCAGGSIIVQDVPPFVMVSGYPSQVHGLNLVGLKRRGFSDETIAQLKQTYRIVYRMGLTIEEAMARIQTEVSLTPEVIAFMDAVRQSERGIIR